MSSGSFRQLSLPDPSAWERGALHPCSWEAPCARCISRTDTPVLLNFGINPPCSGLEAGDSRSSIC